MAVIVLALLIVPAAAAVVAAHYPLSAYPSPSVALGAVGTDPIGACSALTADRSLSKYVPTYAYEFNDEHAPGRQGVFVRSDRRRRPVAITGVFARMGHESFPHMNR